MLLDGQAVLLSSTILVVLHLSVEFHKHEVDVLFVEVEVSAQFVQHDEKIYALLDEQQQQPHHSHY